MAIPSPANYGIAKWKKLALLVLMFIAVICLHKKVSNSSKPIQKNQKMGDKEKPLGYEMSDNEYIPGKDFSKQMISHAWRGYRQFSWGSDELNPISRTGSNFYGQESLALTVIDSLDTLLIAGLYQEYTEARDYALKINFDKEMKISLFESNIRIVGGFLSAFALTGEGKFVSRAFDLANRYLSSFEGYNYPLRDVDLMAHLKVEGKKKKEQGISILAEAGTLSMELGYLSYIIKEPTLRTHALRFVENLGKLTSRYKGLLPKLISTASQEQDGCKIVY